MLGRRDRGGAGTGEHHPDLFDFLTYALQRVQQRGSRNNRRPVLVVVEDGNLHRLPQRLLDVEAVGGPDVLEIDASDGGLEQLAEPDDVVGAFGADLEIEDVEVRELLE